MSTGRKNRVTIIALLILAVFSGTMAILPLVEGYAPREVEWERTWGSENKDIGGFIHHGNPFGGIFFGAISVSVFSNEKFKVHGGCAPCTMKCFKLCQAGAWRTGGFPSRSLGTRYKKSVNLRERNDRRI